MNAIKLSPQDARLSIEFDRVAKPKFESVVATINQLDFESIDMQVYAAYYSGFCCGYLESEVTS